MDLSIVGPPVALGGSGARVISRGREELKFRLRSIEADASVVAGVEGEAEEWIVDAKEDVEGVGRTDRLVEEDGARDTVDKSRMSALGTPRGG